MKFSVRSSICNGVAAIPSSKSETIRALFISALADGISVIDNPLISADTVAAKEAVSAMGATLIEDKNRWQIKGFSGKPTPLVDTIDVGNSGTTARFIISMAALSDKRITIIGDESTSSRPMAPLVNSLIDLKVLNATTTNNKLPVTIQGPAKGGATTVSGETSQYLSSLLIHAPLFADSSQITVESLNEKPYVDMTCAWLDKVSVDYQRTGYSKFEVKGGASYQPLNEKIGGDFSSATFFAMLGAIPGNEVTLTGLDMNDSQGDKAIFDYLAMMGAQIKFYDDKIVVKGDKLVGCRLDINATPDAICAFAALGAIASGETLITNVAQARIKECDRIDVMATELSKMGVKCKQQPDGLTIRHSKLNPATINGHHDHRVVMSFAILATCVEGETTINCAEAVDVTFPNFLDTLQGCKGDISLIR
ncbi:MAG: 3-phosphoshikimate 1-carboxyvinyltransferase [Nitrospinota bacterium]